MNRDISIGDLYTMILLSGPKEKYRGEKRKGHILSFTHFAY
ncbi:MAG: hypothetical protein MASP_00120 [Candidatus Methanolliviera sp. GoM_asphalt]|nr:MAG: hypothetical protein MASP_00120 [Candidatus Methanolliviera sp. GoM_asphalt]